MKQKTKHRPSLGRWGRVARPLWGGGCRPAAWNLLPAFISFTRRTHSWQSIRAGWWGRQLSAEVLSISHKLNHKATSSEYKGSVQAHWGEVTSCYRASVHKSLKIHKYSKAGQKLIGLWTTKNAVWDESHSAELQLIIIQNEMTTTNVHRELSSPRTHYLTTKPSDAKSGVGQLLPLSSKGIKAKVLRQLVLGHTTGRCQSGLKSRLLAPPSTLSV